MMIEGAQQHAPTSPRQIADELVLGIVQLEKSGLLVQSVCLYTRKITLIQKQRSCPVNPPPNLNPARLVP
jgi:hypothetical protein